MFHLQERIQNELQSSSDDEETTSQGHEDTITMHAKGDNDEPSKEGQTSTEGKVQESEEVIRCQRY